MCLICMLRFWYNSRCSATVSKTEISMFGDTNGILDANIQHGILDHGSLGNRSADVEGGWRNETLGFPSTFSRNTMEFTQRFIGQFGKGIMKRRIGMFLAAAMAGMCAWADTWTDPDTGYTWTYRIVGDTAAW